MNSTGQEHTFTCIVFCWSLGRRARVRVVHWHWPRSAITSCPRSAEVVRRHLDDP